MGLDMYLSRKIYTKHWDHIPEPERYAVTVTKGGQPLPIDPKNISYVIEQVGYWRKANAIHKWFVDNVEGGVDQCQEAYVDPDELIELRDLCAEVLANRDQAASKLPTQSGFFFGGTDYDEYYFQDLADTIRIIDDALANPEGDFYYLASW